MPSNTFNMKTIYFWRLGAVTAGLLSIPFVAMLFTTEVNWDWFDFLVMGTLIFGIGLLFGFVSKRLKHPEYKLATATALGTAFFLIWSNLAVGLVGSGPNLPNVLFMIIPMVVILGFILYRGKARSLAMVLFAAAALQVLVPVIAIGIRTLQRGAPLHGEWVYVLGLTAFFTMLWGASGILFLRSGQKHSR